MSLMPLVQCRSVRRMPLVLLALLLPISSVAIGQEVEVDRWLMAGPVEVAMPAFAAETGVASREALELAALLPGWPYEAGEAWPRAGTEIDWAGADEVTWREREGARLSLEGGDGARPRLAWVATFVEVDRYTEAELTVSSPHLVRVFFDGEQVAEKAAADAAEEPEAGKAGDEKGGEGGETEDAESGDAEDDDAGDDAAGDEKTEAVEQQEEESDDGNETAEPPSPGMQGQGGDAETDAGDDEEGGEDAAGGTATASLKLTTGKHLVLVATLFDPEASRPWSLAAKLAPKAGEDDAEEAEEGEQGEETAASLADLTISSSPLRGVTIRDLLDPPQVSAVDLSADGELLAVTLEQPAVPSDDRTSWVEIVRSADGAPVRTLRLPGSVSDFTWGPAGKQFAYQTSASGKTILWIGDLASGRLEPLMRDVEGFGPMLWAPDGESIFVQISESAEADERGVQRIRSLADRWAGFRDLGHLYQVTTGDGSRRRLTAGAFSTSLEDVSPDGSRLLVSRTRFVTETPFVMGDLYELDLGTLEVGPAREITWFGSASYSPDGERVLVLAGPSAFGGVGLASGDAAAPNEYDGQAYLLTMGDTPADDEVAALTRDFDPAVGGAAWSHHDGSLYFTTTDTTYGRVYRWRPGADGGAFTRVDAGPEVVDALAVARDAPTLAVTGSSLQRPGAAWVLSAPGASGRAVVDPSADDFEQVRFGRVEEFSFTTDSGVEIPGLLYYPLGFEEGEPEWENVPLLTYYYGGVVPTTRDFAGRYPKNFWAANGYAVYVLQPSGAVGFGQERSAVHPNDWGRQVVGEIVQGVDAVVAAHPFLDGSKVGCFGGSYGGFLTLRLVTDSDRFAAAISHAGISGIASYWGEGWWGFLYMATAAHGSYPWNNPEVFVEQSPLFKADQVDTPLLLLHGTADPNVPPGESEQMFAALRVLGKEVEYIRIEDEAHWILTYPKRVLWWQTVLAWFDKHLKDEPQWWEELWGESLDRGGP